ncbi:UDP-N-acetylglucosamine 2-epimerase [[Clostridium] innocuum]|nr:UDP-N-acetylglucosamine 2-epimerase [[Clostridium] innocuum]
MIKIALVTATRAEYGILSPLIHKLSNDDDFDLQLLVTGTHLSKKYGNTLTDIENDGFNIYKKFPILAVTNTAKDISFIIANALQQFALYFHAEKPDCVIILGDRTEMFGISIAAMNAGVPIVHLHGGELTEGAIDDCIRHSITKQAYLHFPSTEIYRKRIIQMGENPRRVFNVGALGVENILNVPLFDRNQVCNEVGIPQNIKYAAVTFHPVTLEKGSEKEQANCLITAMDKKNEYFYLITMANADTGGEIVNEMLKQYSLSRSNVKFVTSLGMQRYLSVVKHAQFVLGNSSSGIIEAPSLGTPTVNIGDRQKGRIMAESVINCRPETNDIIRAIEKSEIMIHTPSFIYGDGNTSSKICSILKETFYNNRVNLKKKFYDINF